jgi:hypothetical protein
MHQKHQNYCDLSVFVADLVSQKLDFENFGKIGLI